MNSEWLALPTERATEELAHRLARVLHPGDLLVLSGELGAGKTFFAGALCRALGLDADEPVTSPTFNLVSEYPTTPPMCHADLYRLRSSEDVFNLGLEERRADGALLVVEWGRPYVEVLGGDPVELELRLEPRAARWVEHGARSRAVSRLLAP